MVRINDRLEIPDGELTFSFARSGGPGGQNVNKVNTRVQLRFDLLRSPSLDAEQRDLILSRLSNRISGEGILIVDAHDQRTQEANRQAAVERLAALLAKALLVPRRRRPTRVTAAGRERRLESKRRRASTKQDRGWKPE